LRCSNSCPSASRSSPAFSARHPSSARSRTSNSSFEDLRSSHAPVLTNRRESHLTVLPLPPCGRSRPTPPSVAALYKSTSHPGSSRKRAPGWSFRWSSR
jgi:hypothetical protein